ncbi:MAG: hypothetical protein R6X02_16030 [Enhygromyxa sp.]
MEDLLRFLDLVRRELDCQDARFEFGGESPREPDRVWASVPGGWRVVARFDRLPEADRESRSEKLETLIAAFSGVGSVLQVRSPRFASPSAARELDDALALLAEKADALRAVVIDEDSPVLWGSSEIPAGLEDVEAAMWIGELADSAAAAGLDLVELVQLEPGQLRERVAGLEPRKLRERLIRKLPHVRELGSHRDAELWRAHFVTCRAIAAVRRAPERHEAMEDELGWLARDFGGIYHVILVYDGPFSELGAARVMLRALPAIENLVLALPPIDPTPKGARVLQFKPKTSR